MVGKIRKCICILTAAAVLLGGIQAPVSAEAQGTKLQAGTEGLSQREGVTVTSREEFMDALAQKKSPITVTNLIVIGKDADTDNRMLPVMIPANTLIQGTGNGSICSRSPIQLEGDGICFQNIELTFESSTALGSVPHREIFLAGHSLTLDNVNTYLEGAPELGGFGGSEKELLPTVYAGGYSGKQIGANASLTVRNSNDETMFQAIYMGHDQGSDNKVPYCGTAVLNLDAKAIVREDVNTVLNSQAEINITGGENQAARAKEFYGNEKTTLTLSQVSMEGAVVEGIGNIVLKDKAFLAPVTRQLQNVSLFHGACLDFNDVENPVISGDFSGEADPNEERGILVLNPEGLLTILGNVTGTTQFQTGHRLFPGVLFSGKSYIFAQAGKEEPSFVLAPQKIEEGYGLTYENGGWKISGDPVTFREIGRIEFLSVPTKADLRKIAQKEDGSIPDQNAYFEIKWYDQNQQEFTAEEVYEEYGFYDISYVVKIRTDYWESDSDAILDQTDWFQDVFLVASPEQPGRYYLEAYSQAVPGDYTFLFCSEYLESDLTTVADVKALKNLVKAEKRVIFYDEDQEEPDHMHKFQSSVTKQPSCTEAGEKVFRCECGEYYTEKIDASGHQEVIDPAVAPTETEPGKTAGSHCSVCNEVLNEQVMIPATGTPQEPDIPGHTHVYHSTVTREPFCTEPGEKTFACECGEEYTEEIAALGHKPVTDPAVEPTETEPGKTEGSHCEVCGEIIKAQETIPAAGSPEHVHTYESIVTKAPTCTEAGVRTNTCECGEEYTEEIAALGHKPVTDPAVEPTETEPGKTEGSHCSVCNEILKAQETIAATGTPEDPIHVHKYQCVITEPTCARTGIKTYTCNCGDTYTEEITVLLRHQYVDKCIPATVKSSGILQQVCSVCSDTKLVSVINSPQKIRLNKTEFTYDGKVKKPSVTVKDSKDRSLKAGTDYQIISDKVGKNPGVYTIAVEFRGKYSGRLTENFTIRPKKTSLKKTAAKSRGIQVTWNRQAAQIDGYQIQCCTSGNFKGKTLKSVTAKKSAVVKKISGLKGKKKYYVRIRTYKTVKVNGKKQKLYSGWSGRKTVRTKK